MCATRGMKTAVFIILGAVFQSAFSSSEILQFAGSEMRNSGTTCLHPQRFAAAGVLLFITLIVACKAPQATEETQVPATTQVRTQDAVMDSNSRSSTDSDPAVALDAAISKG